MRTSLLLGTLLAVTAIAPGAAALSQSKHRSLSVAACRAQKLPDTFCTSVGTAAYNVDHFEWSSLDAHAQPEAGESLCVAANKTLTRVSSLSAELRDIASGQSVYDPALAVALGRALHTLQDNCAHRGITNAQHAWHSLSDSCTDSESSPDVQPDALTCAKEQSELALQAFAKAIHVPEPPAPPFGQESTPEPQYLPARGDVCEFLKSATAWDGVDRRWKNARMIPALRDAFAAGLVGGPQPADPCAEGPSSLDDGSGEPTDVTHPTEWCTSVQLYCAGKGDDASTAPPWESAERGPAPATPDAGGCTFTAGATPPSGIGVSLAALLALARRRPRTGPRRRP